jgi:glycosyltransferase involved in cell wall biosynthesis
MLKVLLISPMDPDVPGDLKLLVGGENTYTRTLLANPPEGVEYVHHTQALRKGLIEYLPIQKVLANLVKFRILPLSCGTQAILLKEHFDLVHVHAYSVKILGKKTPLVLSDSSSNYLFLRDYLNWPWWRIRSGYVVRKFIFDKFGVIDADTNLGDASKLIVFSQFAAKIHKDLGVPAKKIKVIYPGLPPQKIKERKDKNIINILFIGIWFERKGGPLLLEAFNILFKKFPNLRLTIIGPIPKDLETCSLPIFQKDFVPRRELFNTFFPNADILVLVPPKAEGYGFVVEEAASFGIPAVVSRVYALPEIVEDGETGFVVESGSVADLVEKLEILITDEKLRQKFGKAALAKFEKDFSIEKSNQKLLEVYQIAIKG